MVIMGVFLLVVGSAILGGAYCGLHIHCRALRATRLSARVRIDELEFLKLLGRDDPPATASAQLVSSSLAKAFGVPVNVLRPDDRLHVDYKIPLAAILLDDSMHLLVDDINSYLRNRKLPRITSELRKSLTLRDIILVVSARLQ